jgi:hypothetical protein
MHRAHLFLVTALLEVGTGVSLLVLPSVPLALLLGVSVAAPETLLVARVAGAALIAIGVACWPARGAKQVTAQLGLLTGILIYDVAAAALLGYSGLVLGMAGIALWPAVGLHTGLAVWCVACLRTKACRAGVETPADSAVEDCEKHSPAENGRKQVLPTPPR